MNKFTLFSTISLAIATLCWGIVLIINPESISTINLRIAGFVFLAICVGAILDIRIMYLKYKIEKLKQDISNKLIYHGIFDLNKKFNQILEARKLDINDTVINLCKYGIKYTIIDDITISIDASSVPESISILELVTHTNIFYKSRVSNQ